MQRNSSSLNMPDLSSLIPLRPRAPLAVLNSVKLPPLPAPRVASAAGCYTELFTRLRRCPYTSLPQGRHLSRIPAM